MAAQLAMTDATLRDPLLAALARLLGPKSTGESSANTIACQADDDDVQQSRQGDPDAYKRIVERYQTRIGMIIWRFTRDRNEYEELIHEVFVEAYLGLNSYRAEAPLGHWLARIATRVGYRHWRQNRIRQRARTMSDEAWACLGHPGDGQDCREAADLAHHLLAQLPPRDRLVLTLRYLQQHDTATTAYLTGWSKVRVRVQTHRALGKLRALASKTGFNWELK